MKNLIIRKAYKSDVGSIISINRENWLLKYPNQELNITREDIQNFLDSVYKQQKESLNKNIEQGYYFVAELESNIVGFCRYKEIDPEIFELKTMYVDPKFQSIGFGTLLFNKTVSEFKNKKELFLFVAEYNIQAINFYKKLGFVETKEKKIIEIGNNKFITNIKMVYGK
jgi:ribosomal protein S18 acetylase RimI-like enzyme